jgi:hypothetical protein
MELYRTIYINRFSYMQRVIDLIDQNLIIGNGIRSIGVTSMQDCPDRWTYMTPHVEDDNEPWTSFWKNMEHLLRHAPGLTTLYLSERMPDSFLKGAVVPGCAMLLTRLYCVVHLSDISTLSAISSLVVLRSLHLKFLDPPFPETLELPRNNVINPSVSSFSLDMPPEYEPSQAAAMKQALTFLGRTQFFPGADGRAGCSFELLLNNVADDALLCLNPLFERHANSSIYLKSPSVPEMSSIFQAADQVDLECVPPALLFQAVRLPPRMDISFEDEVEAHPAIMDIVHTLLRSSRPHRLDMVLVSEFTIFTWKASERTQADVRFSSSLADQLHPHAANLRKLGVEILDGYGNGWDEDYRVLNVPRNGL